MKRSSYHYIDISSFKDLLEQMEYKKGTLAHGYLRKIVNQVDIVGHLEKINEQVELIERAMNRHINLNCGQVEYHLENLPLTLDQLLTKNFSPFLPLRTRIYLLNGFLILINYPSFRNVRPSSFTNNREVSHCAKKY